jgi:hypothetical protein
MWQTQPQSVEIWRRQILQTQSQRDNKFWSYKVWEHESLLINQDNPNSAKFARCENVKRKFQYKDDIWNICRLITVGLNGKVLITRDCYSYNIKISANEGLDNCSLTVCKCLIWQQHIVFYINVGHTERT